MSGGLLLIQGSAGALLAWLGLWSIEGDLRANKVQNRRVLQALAGLALLLAALALLERPPAWDLTRSALNAAACFAAALALWLAGVWPAGDAKFFFVMGSLIPLAAPAFPSGPGRLFLILLINSFVPAAALSLERALRKSLRPEERGEAWKGLAAALAERARSGLPAAACVYLVLLALGERLGGWRGPWLYLTLPLVLSFSLGGMLKGRPRLAEALLSAACLGALGLKGLEAGLGLLRLAAGLAFLQLAVLLTERDRWRRVPAATLAAGARVNPDALRESLGRRSPGLYERHYSVLYPDGLLAGQARALRLWCRLAKVEEVETARTIPFVPYMAAGGLLTLALRGDCLSFLRAWAARLL